MKYFLSVLTLLAVLLSGFLVHGKAQMLLLGVDNKTSSQVWLVNENFETPTTGYDSGLTWTTGGNGTVEPAYTTGPLRGSQSCYITGGTTETTTRADFASTGDIWAHWMWSTDVVNVDATVTLFSLQDNTATPRGFVQITTAGKIVLKHSTVTANEGSASMSAGTTYHFWLHYAVGSGANGVAAIYRGTTSTRPASPLLSIANGNGTQAITRVRFGCYYVTNPIHYKYDHILISASEIGDVAP